jgi:methionyl-tRNA formyltransferase
LRLQVIKVTLLDAEAHERAEFNPGEYLPGRQLLIATGAGVLRIDQVKPEGRKLVTGSDFLLGQPMKLGDKLGPPAT